MMKTGKMHDGRKMDVSRTKVTGHRRVAMMQIVSHTSTAGCVESDVVSLTTLTRTASDARNTSGGAEMGNDFRRFNKMCGDDCQFCNPSPFKQAELKVHAACEIKAAQKGFPVGFEPLKAPDVRMYPLTAPIESLDEIKAKWPEQNTEFYEFKLLEEIEEFKEGCLPQDDPHFVRNEGQIKMEGDSRFSEAITVALCAMHYVASAGNLTYEETLNIMKHRYIEQTERYMTKHRSD